jgi:hypothetical protein
VTEHLTGSYAGPGFEFRYPEASTVDVDTDPSALASVVLTDAEQPLLVVAAVEDSPLGTPSLQVPGLLGRLLDHYRQLGGYEELWYGRLPVTGSDTAEATEIRYGTGDPRQALLVAARIDGPRIVTLQVHFPPSTAEENRPVAVAIVESLAVRVPPM